MTIKMRIPTPLRRFTRGEGMLNLTASSVSECIDKIEAQFPGVKERLFDESGELRPSINIYVNSEDIRYLQGLDTSLKDGDEVSIVPAIAGGG